MWHCFEAFYSVTLQVQQRPMSWHRRPLVFNGFRVCSFSYFPGILKVCILWSFVISLNHNLVGPREQVGEPGVLRGIHVALCLQESL